MDYTSVVRHVRGLAINAELRMRRPFVELAADLLDLLGMPGVLSCADVAWLHTAQPTHNQNLHVFQKSKASLAENVSLR